ncbi:MAG: hypothetical protein AB7S75_24625 [Desulfococcaceae bacterium]
MPVYEGPEKKLELILSSSLPGLRSDTDGRWKRVVKSSRAKIISKVSTDFMDAYLLSESSLFVWENRVILITCGKTAPLRSLPLLLDIVGKDKVAFLFYEQRNFIPPGDHSTDFEKNAAEISRWFTGKSDIPEFAGHRMNMFHYFDNAEKTQKPRTLQMMMHDLPDEVMQTFCRNGKITASETRRISGLEALCDPLMMTDDHLFHPCGYSLNAIMEKQYLTVHVTPQPVNSYVSFETDIVESGWQKVIRKVLEIFRPAEFSLILRIGMDDEDFSARKTMEPSLHGYWPAEKNLYESDCGYAVLFFSYIRQE